MNKDNRFSYNFKRIRIEKKWTPEYTSEIANCERNYIYQIENGFVGFGIRAQKKWAKIFDVDVSEFFKDPSESDPLEARCLAACRKARELGLESALLEHLDMIEYKIEKAAHDPPEVKDVANLKY